MPELNQQITAAIKIKQNGDLNSQCPGDLIILACQSSCAIEAARCANGFPPTIPAPWPQSTWEFQKQWTRQVMDAT